MHLAFCSDINVVMNNKKIISLKDFKTQDSNADIMDSFPIEGIYRLFTIDQTGRGFEITHKLFERGRIGLPKVRTTFLAELRSFDDAVKFVSDIYGQRFDCGIGFGAAQLDANSPSAIKLRITVDNEVYDHMDVCTRITLNA